MLKGIAWSKMAIYLASRENPSDVPVAEFSPKKKKKEEERNLGFGLN